MWNDNLEKRTNINIQKISFAMLTQLKHFKMKLRWKYQTAFVFTGIFKNL